jgi:hypothetical protein
MLFLRRLLFHDVFGQRRKLIFLYRTWTWIGTRTLVVEAGISVSFDLRLNFQLSITPNNRLHLFSESIFANFIKTDLLRLIFYLFLRYSEKSLE